MDACCDYFVGTDDEWEFHQESHRRVNILAAMPKAVEQLIEMIMTEHNANDLPIKMITVIPDSQNPDSWVAYAILNDDKAFHYAIYITRDGQLIADGF